MVERADKNTITAKTREIYSDFMNDLDVNPFTGNLARVVNEEAVRQSLKNIVLTMCGERFYAPNKGSKILGSLFELYDMNLLNVITMQLRETCLPLEPRAEILDVSMNEGLDANQYEVTITYSVRHIMDQKFTLTLNVQRNR